RVLLFRADARAVLQDLGGRMAEVVLEALDPDRFAIHRALRFLEAVDDVVDVLRADLRLEERLLHAALEGDQALLDRLLARLRRLGLAVLLVELLALADETAELADVLQELGGALVLFALRDLGGGGLGGVVVAEDVARFDLARAEAIGEGENVLD